MFTVSDEDNLTADITNAWATFEARYNAMTAAQQERVNNLAEIDFDTGSIQVAGHDVEALAEELDWSADVLQNFLDLTGDYSTEAPSNLEAASDAIQILNDDVYSLSKTLNASQKAKPIWDELSVPARAALESFTEGLNLDPT